MKFRTMVARVGSGRSDFTNALVAVGVTAAVVVALMAPASRGIRPSALMERATSLTFGGATADGAIDRTVTSSSRPARSLPITALVGVLAPVEADEQPSQCVPCVAAAGANDRLRSTPAEARRTPRQAPPAVETPSVAGSAAVDPGTPPATRAAADAPDRGAAPQAPASRPTPTQAAERTADRPEPAATGSEQRSDRAADAGTGRTDADAPSPSAPEDRPGNAASATRNQNQKAKDR